MPARIAPYGAWKSPITSELIVSETIGFAQVALDGDDVYWIETRPSEGGRHVVVRRTPAAKTTDLTPSPFNVRTRVNEYGGGAMTVVNGTLWFSNFADQRLYRQDPDSAPTPITSAADLRYADGVVDTARGRMICVREDHTVAGREAVTTLVAVALAGDPSNGQVLVSGNDFYASPRLSPDGRRLAWLTWNHPNMPWDGCELWVGTFAADGSVADVVNVAGHLTESIFQPEWSPDGTLYFVSDRSGWGNLYRWTDRVEAVHPMAAEFGAAQWVFGISAYAFESAERIMCAFGQLGTARLGSLDTRTRRLDVIETPYPDIREVRAARGRVVLIAGSPTEALSVVRFDLVSGNVEVVCRSTRVAVDPAYLSIPRAVEFPTTDGETAHAFVYPPTNRDFVAPAGERPPLLVISHGGPTGATSTALNLARQYWTSRGFCVVDVNYRGSTGYGRAYRVRLNGQWGIADVDDCINAARDQVARGEADGARLAIRGGSAGGYTTLCALTFHDVFTAGASHFGISDLEALARETHKLESRYLDHLIGPYPERRDLYVQRSPIHSTDRLSCPLILFQGLDDKVVPPNQAETMFAAVRAKGLPVAYVAFEGEQHGFRRAENIRRALDAELYFYSKIFGFAPGDPVVPVPIENLP